MQGSCLLLPSSSKLIQYSQITDDPTHGTISSDAMYSCGPVLWLQGCVRLLKQYRRWRLTMLLHPYHSPTLAILLGCCLQGSAIEPWRRVNPSGGDVSPIMSC